MYRWNGLSDCFGRGVSFRLSPPHFFSLCCHGLFSSSFSSCPEQSLGQIFNICHVIPSRYYTSLLFGTMAIFGLIVFYLFCCWVINLVIWFSIYSVLQIWSNGPACFKNTHSFKKYTSTPKWNMGLYFFTFSTCTKYT